MTNAKDLGFLFGYLEKSALKGLRLRAPKRAPVAAKPKPTPAPAAAPVSKAAPPAGAVPRKQVREMRAEPLRAGPRPEVAAKATPPASKLETAKAVSAPAPARPNEDSYGDMARALGENVGAGAGAAPAAAFVPLEERLSPMTGIRPSVLQEMAQIATGAGAGHLIGKSFRSPHEEALNEYLMANPFMYNQMNPYAMSMMA